jgi:Fe-S-cluster containining protein
MKGGPTLHREDAELFETGILKRSHVYTLRKGEMVYNNIKETMFVLPKEIIKIKGRDKEWTCMLYDDEQKACTIYEHRPIECRLLKCWDTRELKGIFMKRLLQRRHLIAPQDGMLEIIAAHEKRCSYAALSELVEKLKGPDSENAMERILDILRYDCYFRPFITERLNISLADTDFLFGRPLNTTIHMFGLRVKQDGKTFWLLPEG